MGLLETIRRWVDGDAGDDALASVDEQAKPRRVWEEFLVQIAREVETVMQREMFTPPGGETFIPPEYIVYLSPDDDKEWQGDKRRGLEQGLFYVLSERAKELSGQTKLATKSFAVELRVDGTLEKGQFRVQPVWDATQQASNTMVTPRRGQGASDITSTMFDEAASANASQAAEGDDSEATQVRARPAALYSLEIWRDGVRQTVMPVTKNVITIGRGSRTIPVDVAIRGDAEVSRQHVILERDDEGKYFLTAKGRNPTMILGAGSPREAPRDQRTPVAPDERIEIASYSLRIQP